ncbi:MAG: hypothetical protein E7483_06460 [Ruminococcaceae bacterium]|nr:hypothetical protein [Oscillospiraceae bacterium]
MNDLLTMIINYFNLAILAIGALNAIFSRALGISPGIKMLRDPRKNTFYFCGALTVFQIMTSVIVYFAAPMVDTLGFGAYRRFVLPTIIVVACAISYVVVIVLLSAVLSQGRFREIVQSVTGASINSAIVGTVILSQNYGLNLSESIVFGIASSIGYFIAMLLISEADKKICHDRVPQAFKGLPITLIYISVLALAVYGLTGHAIAL